MELWIIFSILNPIIFAIVNITDKRVLSEFNLSIKSFNLFVGLSQGIIGIFLFLLNFPENLTLKLLLIGCSIGVLQGIGLIIMFWMIQKTEPSRVSTIMSTYPIYVAIMGVIIFNEILSILNWVAIILAITGTIIASLKFSEQEKKNNQLFEPLLLLLVISAILIGTSHLITKSISEEFSPYQIVSMRGIGISITMMALFLRKDSLRDLFSFIIEPKRSLWLISSQGLAPVFGHLSITYAISNGPVALVSTITSSRTVFIFIISLIGSYITPKLVHEKFIFPDIIFKFISVLMVVASIIMITYL